MSPQRPVYGIMAWQTVVGYLSVHHSPDAALKWEVFPDFPGGEVRWSASLEWGNLVEAAHGLPTCGEALAALWGEVERFHDLFGDESLVGRLPEGYAPDQWFDPVTDKLLRRMIETIRTVFHEDWRLVTVYRPAESPLLRVEMRLLVEAQQARVGGRGANVLEAARSLFRNAAPVLASYAGVIQQMLDN